MLELQNLVWKLPNGEPIIDGISYKASSKLIVVTGPNGGGKTTLAKLIAGVEAPDSGRILLDGEDITDLNITDRAKKGVAYAFQQPVRFKGLTVRDLLLLAAGENVWIDTVLFFSSPSAKLRLSLRENDYVCSSEAELINFLEEYEGGETLSMSYMRNIADILKKASGQ